MFSRLVPLPPTEMDLHDSREPHFFALKRILRYVQGTLDYGLQLFSSTTDSLIAYSDADWAGCPTTRRSTSGYCVFLGNNLLSCSSKRQSTLSCSSAEAEYLGVANAVAETCWIRNLLRELHTPLSSATIVYCDNVQEDSNPDGLVQQAKLQPLYQAGGLQNDSCNVIVARLPQFNEDPLRAAGEASQHSTKEGLHSYSYLLDAIYLHEDLLASGYTSKTTQKAVVCSLEMAFLLLIFPLKFLEHY
ncbi:ribonuclease H-like domain-containing protein [Tanacetum coccineum]